MLSVKKVITISLFILVAGYFFILSAGKPLWVHNSLKEIDSCQEKIKLTLVYVWGDDKVDDENQFFRYPKDIKISNGSVYILDSGNNRIQVYDMKKTFKRTVGHAGQGPSDIHAPTSFAIDLPGNILVLDYGNRRIQTLDCNGKYLNSFKIDQRNSSTMILTGDNKIAVDSIGGQSKGSTLISILNPKGQVEKRIGKYHYNPSSIEDKEAFYLESDNQSNFYCAFWGTPFFRKYSKNGDPLLIVTYEVPFKSSTIAIDPSNAEPRIKTLENKRVAAGLALDEQSRIFLVVAKRYVKKSEKIGFVSDGNGNWRRAQSNIESENTDRFRLLVFNPMGKIVAAAQLNVFCDKIYIYGDHLFIIDMNIGMKIYEYKITFS